jgi:hypothetical protein
MKMNPPNVNSKQKDKTNHAKYTVQIKIPTKTGEKKITVAKQY